VNYAIYNRKLHFSEKSFIVKAAASLTNDEIRQTCEHLKFAKVFSARYHSPRRTERNNGYLMRGLERVGKVVRDRMRSGG
jgi:hypothetical protein